MKRVMTEQQRAMARVRWHRWHSKNKDRERERLAKFREINRDSLNEKSRLWRKNNPERSKAIKMKWELANPEKIKAKSTRWIEQNHERVKSSRRASYERRKSDPAYKEKVKSWKAQYKNTQPYKDQRRRMHLLRKARLRLASKFGAVDLEYVRILCNGRCGICHEIIHGPFHYDHIVPIARGGQHSTENLQIAHPLCNVKKKDRLPGEFNTNAATGVYVSLNYK